MANLFANLPVTPGNGSGAAVDVSAFGYYKTVSVSGSFVGTVTIEISNQAVPTQWAPVAGFGNADGANLGVAAHWMRATVTGYVRGVPTCDVGGTDEGAAFASLPVTPGDGAGAAIDVSSLPLLKTITVGGPFRGYVQIEVSEDGLARWSQIGFGFNNPGSESQQIVARYMRVVRSGVPQLDPGLPVVNVGACAIATGGGGATIIVEDEGVPVAGGPFSTLDFVGEGVVASGGGGTATITIPRTVAVDGTTITGDGSTGSPLAVDPAGLAGLVAVAVDGTTITGDGTAGNPLVAVIPPDTGITQLTTDVLAGPGSGTQAATVIALQGNAVTAAVPAANDVLTWNGAAWAPAATATTGITQLTNDVTAGPGTGTQAATVTALQGNPVAIAAPVNAQVLTWNGSAWVPGSVSSGSSGGGGVIYYLNQGTAPQAPTVNLPAGVRQFGQVAEIAGATVTSGVLPTVGNIVVASFVTDVNVPGLTAIPAGIWDYNVWAQSATSTTPGEILLIYEVYVYDGVNPPTLIDASPDIPLFDPTSLIQYIGSAIVPQTPILVTDRIFVEIHAYATTPGQTVTIAFGGSYPSHVHTTLPSIAGTGIAHVVNGAFVSPAAPVILSSAIEVTGVLPIANGGTNTATAPANGELLIGNAGSYNVASLTAGINITITPGPGAVTVAAAPYAVIFDDAVPGANLSIRSDRAIQSPINNALPAITNLGSQTNVLNPAATGATGEGSTIGGGIDNSASGYGATVPGGGGNTATGDYAHAQGLLATALRETQHSLAAGLDLSALGGGVAHGPPQTSHLVLRGSTKGGGLFESVELGFGLVGTPGIELQKGVAYLFKVQALAFGIYSGGPYGSRAYELAFTAYSLGAAPVISALGPGAIYGDPFSQTWTLTLSTPAAPDRIALTFDTGSSQSECWVVARVDFTEYRFI